jgi:RNA polymerase sigma-B factor
MDELSAAAEPSDGVDEHDEIRALFERYRRDQDRAVRNQIIEAHRPLARQLARRFRGRGEPSDDLEQVAIVGVLKAVERFDLGRGVEFASFATVTVVGELKRYLRDRTWRIRVPRGAQERSLQLGRAIEDLGHRYGRAPTVQEIARELGCRDDDVLEAMEVNASYRNVNPDSGSGDFAAGWMSRRAADPTDAYETIDDADLLRRLLDRLPPREREICELRFVDELTQSEIARRVGISQMHVSRLLRASIDHMRRHAETCTAGDGAPGRSATG